MSSAAKSIAEEVENLQAFGSKARVSHHTFERGIFRYGLAVLSVALAFGIKVFLQQLHFGYPLSTSFLAAIAVTFWYAGTGPGILALVLSCAAFGFFVLPYQVDYRIVLADGSTKPVYASRSGLSHLLYFFYFALVALVMSWFSSSRRRAERLLSQARDRLETKVAERTARLRKLNDELLGQIAERALAEDHLRQTEQRLRDLIANTPVILFALDRSGKLTLSEGKGLDTFGVKPGELVGQSIFDLYQDSPDLHSNARRALAGESVTFVTEAKNQFFEIHLIPVLDKSEKVAGVTGVTYNITDQRKTERELRLVIDTIPAMSWWTLADGPNEYCSKGWMAYTGMKHGEELGYGWLEAFHPEDREAHFAKWRAATETGGLFESVARIRGADGVYRWFLTQGVPLRDESGKIVRWYGTNVDIDERKRAEALLTGENRILEMVAKGDSLSEILNSLCRLVEEQASNVLASILLVEDDRLRHGGAPDLLKAYTEAIDGTAIGPIAGSCGTAAYTGTQVIVEDIATDPLWVEHRDKALSHSLRACWSTPIFSTEGKVIGTFAMYYREPRRPTERDQQIIGQITHLAGIAIERKLTQDKLSLSERNLTEAQKLTHTGSFVWDIPSKNALYLSDEWYRIYGFEIGEARAWEERVNRLGPEETKQWEETVARAIEQKSIYEIEKHIVLPDGTRKSLHVIGHPVLNSSAEVVQFIGTVTDITEQKRAEQRLRGSEARFRTFVDHATDAFMLFGEDKTVVDVNRQACEALGYTREELIGMKPTEFDPHADPSFLKGIIERIDAGEVVTFESRHRRKDGTVFPVEVRARLFSDGGRKFSLALVRDISERKRAQALLAGEKQLLEMIATGVPLKQILNALCGIIEEQRPGTLASVLLMNPDGVHLNVIAGPRLPNEWTRQMELMPIGPCAGSCGTAAYRGSPVIVSDIANDPLWDVPEHRASALKHGLRASWSNPVLSWKGDVLGTFCLYYQERRAPTSKDLELIELATHLVRVAIERDRAQEALRASERVARSHVEVMMRSLDVLATESAPEKFIGEMLRTIGQHLRATRVVLFLRNPQDDTVRMRLVIEDDRQVAVHSDHPFANDPYAWKQRPLFQELLFTKSPVVVDDVEADVRVEPEFREYLKRHRCKRFMGVPMFVSGELRGFIGIHHSEKGSYRADEIELAQALAHHVMMAAHGQELVEQQREAAVLKERTRMARDIHDTLAQGFTGVIVQMEAAEEALLDDDQEHAVGHVRRARELARDSLGEARRSVHALRPQALEKAAFADALRAIVKNTAAGTALHTEFRITGEPRLLSQTVEENLLHIGQEALTNTLKHAHASNFSARISFDSEAVYLELHDNGDGFDVDGINGGGIGLIGMKERADEIGATIKVTSEPGKGTKITAVSPYQSA